MMLRAQEPIVWTNSSTARIFDGILAFTVHAKPKVRKAAQHAVCAVLKGLDNGLNKLLLKVMTWQ